MSTSNSDTWSYDIFNASSVEEYFFFMDRVIKKKIIFYNYLTSIVIY